MNDEDLLNDLADALEEMTNKTCADMRVLWLEGTKKLRQKYLPAPNAEVPDHLKKRSPSFRSKYQALARWRHGVVWQKLLESPDKLPQDVKDAEEYAEFLENQDLLQAIYFEPCANEPPYSYSQKKSASPRFKEVPFAESRVLSGSIRGAWASLKILEKLHSEAEGGPEADFLKASISSKSLDDILKFDSYRRSRRNADKYSWPDPNSEQDK